MVVADTFDLSNRWDIHRHGAPAMFDLLEPKAQMFETGVKVLDLLTPTCRAARSASVARWRWVTVLITEMINQTQPTGWCPCSPVGRAHP